MKPISYSSSWEHEGRIMCYTGKELGAIRRARLVMMNFLHTKHIPRRLHVHHINGDRLDDRIENLELKLDTDHAKGHVNPDNIPRDILNKMTRKRINAKPETKARVKKWTKDNWPRLYAKHLQYEEENKERLKEYRHEYYLKNREKILEYHRQLRINQKGR